MDTTAARPVSAWNSMLPGFAPSALAEPPAALEREELSFIMIKPDGVQRGLIAEIIARCVHMCVSVHLRLTCWLCCKPAVAPDHTSLVAPTNHTSLAAAGLTCQVTSAIKGKHDVEC